MPPNSRRRPLFARLTALAATALAGAPATSAAAATPEDDGPNWPGTVPGRHRQVFDATEPNGGLPLTFAHTFRTTNAPGAATAVVVLRHAAMPLAVDSPLWAKYKIGEANGINDPETKAPATKNPWLHPKPGVLMTDAIALDRMVAAGILFGVCNVALVNISGRLAANAGVTAEEAAREWAANLIPGMTLLPSGVWAVNRAQEAGCTYCMG